MSPQNSRPKEPSHSDGAAHARGQAARLALLLCGLLALAQAPAPAQQTQKAAEPAPTPYVRPRKVTPKEEPQTQTPPAPQPAPAQPQSSPAQQPAARPADATRPADAPAQPGQEVDEDEVVRVDSNLVIIPASVVDARGRAITDLKAEDFELKVDGEVKPIGELTRSETPVNVALLFDNSYSLSSAREFEKQAAVRFFRSVVRPIDRAAVYSISNTPTLSQGLTNDVPRLVRTVERFGAPEGATALFEAVAQASEYMRPLPGRKVLVIVSDGADTVSDVSFDEAVNRALRAECQVYVVQTRQVEDPNLHDTVSEQRMYRITEQTGGAVYVPHSVEELDAVFTQISLDLSQQYLLSYYPQDDRKDKYFRFISLRVKTRPSLRVRARKGFYPEAARAQGGAQGGSPGLPANAPSPLSAPAPPPAEVAASYTRPAATPETRTAARDASANGRRQAGPDGPDTEEAAARKPSANDPVATFTVTTSAAAPKTPEPQPRPAAPERAVNRDAPANLFTLPPTTPSPARPKEESAPEAEETKPPAPAPKPADAKPASEGEAPKESRATVSGGVLNGKALSLPRPTYPAAARSAGASGTVVVEVTIDERGRVVAARAVSGHVFLQQAAVQAARLARFSPATLSGEPVRVKGTINYVFTLP
ncbi:MAG TPA: VWA domain-containing protein [Pyrinomonadaceae bacterium]